MRNKKFYYLATLIVTSSMLVFTGCSKKAEPVISESVEEPEPAEEPEPVEPEELEESIEDATPSENPANEENLEDMENEIETTEIEEDTEEENEPDLGYEIISTDEVVMYCTVNSANIRKGPGTQYEKAGSLSYSQEITVSGKVESDGSTWYVIKTSSSDDVQMVSGSLLSTTKPQPAPQKPAGNSQTQQPSQSEQPSGGSSSSGGLETDDGGELPDGMVIFDLGDAPDDGQDWGLY